MCSYFGRSYSAVLSGLRWNEFNGERGHRIRVSEEEQVKKFKTNGGIYHQAAKRGGTNYFCDACKTYVPALPHRNRASQLHGCRPTFNASFELTGKGFFFFLVMIQDVFDMFGNVIQVMFQNTFTQLVDFVSSF